MCRFKSGVIFKHRVVLAPLGNESHSDLLKSLNIEDSFSNAAKMFVRAELIPEDNKITDISTWAFNVDQDIVPDWFIEDKERYEQEFRDAVNDWLKNHFKIMFNRLWTEIVDGDKTYYILFGIMGNFMFGNNNNYAESKVRNYLIESDLAKEIKETFGNRVVPITTDLTSVNGFKDYGKVEGDTLAIPTISLLMKYGEQIPLIDNLWWLATSNQTPSRNKTSYVQYVRSNGSVDYDGCSCNYGGVRPFFVLQS